MLAFLFNVFGNVPNCVVDGSRSTWLLMSDGTDSVLLIFETRIKIKNNNITIIELSEREKKTFCLIVTIT